jgi:SET domain-containing protein
VVFLLPSSFIFSSFLLMIEKRRSRIQGWGVFATQPIAKNTRIVHYAGEKITNQESLRREARYLKKGHIWCFKLNRLYVRDAAVGGNIARYVNHSCNPNCYTQVTGDTIWIRAARNIRRGEEITYDYSTDGVGSIQCRCQPGCTVLL